MQAVDVAEFPKEFTFKGALVGGNYKAPSPEVLARYIAARREELAASDALMSEMLNLK